jgi:hypothetical protein
MLRHGAPSTLVQAVVVVVVVVVAAAANRSEEFLDGP